MIRLLFWPITIPMEIIGYLTRPSEKEKKKASDRLQVVDAILRGDLPYEESPCPESRGSQNPNWQMGALKMPAGTWTRGPGSYRYERESLIDIINR